MAALAFLGAPARGSGQNVNPDISVIGDVRAWITDGQGDPKEGELELDLASAELAIQGYLNPFARADLYVGYHDGSFELEELYATILRGLPGGLQLRAGKYRVDFGKLNLLHPHAYSFLDPPLAHQQYLGEEGLSDVGVNLNWQGALGETAITLSGNVLKGDFAKPHAHELDEESEPHAAHLPWLSSSRAAAEDHEDVAPAVTDLGYSGRVSLFVPTGDYAGVEVGFNALTGTLDRLTGRHVQVHGIDAKYRWAPDKRRSVTVQGEWIRSRRDVLHHHGDHGLAAAADGHDIERVSADGFFAFVDWRFRQRWNLGVIVERADAAEEEGASLERAGVFAGFQMMEETTMIRLLLRRTAGDQLDGPVSEGILQLVFSLGPHRAHWF